MAYYAALVSLMGLLQDIIHGDHQYADLYLGRETIINSLYEKSSFLEKFLKEYSSKGDEEGDRMEGLIKDATERAQVIIFSAISLITEWRNSNRSTSNLGGSMKDTPERAQDINLSVTSKKIKWRIPCWPTRNHGSELKKVEQEIDSIVGELKEVEQEIDSIVGELKEVEQEIDSIVQELTAINEKRRREKTQLDYDHSAHTAPFEQGAPDGGHLMVGFDKYLNTIKEQLCGQSSRLQLIPIVGAGGIGKTTLARNIFDDSLVRGHFDRRAWATISQDYRVKDVLKSLTKSLRMKDDEANNKDDEIILKLKIYQFLKGRRFLVVIDDIWNSNDWDDMKRIFPDDGNGSRIVLTTRSLGFAEYADMSDFVHEVQLLTEEESWDLLRNNVFGHDCCPTELEDIGKSIASKCSGLPLAIVVIAGILTKTRTQVNWEEIARKMHEIFSKTNKRLSSILSLSYHHLPHQLKACFLHMGSFPEDFVISISNLIHLWVSEGLLKSPDESKTIESFGEECLKDLVKRNLVIVTKKRANGEFKMCVLHDLLRNFCRRRASSEYFFYGGNDGDFGKTRRCILHGSESYLERCPSEGFKRLGSLLLFGGPHELNVPEMNLDKFKQLGTFCAYCLIQEPEEFNMPHLKHLMLHFADMYHISSIILQLQNLQTLVIHSTFYSDELPPEIWKMTKLRHLIIPDGITLPPVPVDVETSGTKLECLQTLMTVRKFMCTNEVINMMPNLRKLKTHYTYKCYDMWNRYDLNNLTQLLQLEELKIGYSNYRNRVGSFPNGIAFPVNLKKLSLLGCCFPWEDIMVVSSLPNLQVLRLRKNSFIGDEWESADGEFRSLKFLVLEDLDLKRWQVENSHFPCLEHLKIRLCDMLVEIPQDIGDIPTLKYIDLYQTRQEVTDSATQIQQEQEDQGNYMLQVRINQK